MEDFSFRVSQPFKGYYNGFGTIEAESLEEAKSKLEAMTSDELAELVGDWEQGDDTYEDGDVELEDVYE
jgi:hypothetical protein